MDQGAHLRLRQGVAGAASVEALPDTILLCAIRANNCLNFVQGGIAAVGAEQAPRLLQSNTTHTHSSPNYKGGAPHVFKKQGQLRSSADPPSQF